MASSRPNVLLIMSDQHHASFLGCAGDPHVRTPHLDALAAAGTRFDSTYCPFPLCCPSRMAFMTGRHCHDIEVWTNDRALHPDTPTFAHAFASAGYQTVISGRMHFVGGDQMHGFHERLCHDCNENPWIKTGWGLERVLGDLKDTPGCNLTGVVKSGPGPSGYQAYDEYVRETTADWLRAQAARDDERPFLLVAGLVLPHCPFVAPPDLFDYYAERITLDDLPPTDPNLGAADAEWAQRTKVEPPPDRESQWRTRVAYYALCEHVDRTVGEMLDALAESGLADNTIVVYTSDHGEMLGEHGLWWKSTFYDGASRVPLLISAPGAPGGRVAGENVSLIDIAPTLLDLAGAEPLPGIGGRSFAPLLAGPDPAWADTVFVENVPLFHSAQRVCPSRMVKRGPWKYIHYHGVEAQLFNTAEDPDELHNRIADPACADLVAELRALVLRDWDPEHVQRRLATLGAEHRLIADGLRQTLANHLIDPPWFGDTPPANDHDKVPYSRYHG